MVVLRGSGPLGESTLPTALGYLLKRKFVMS